jgi:hypothetical protein
MLQIVLSLFNMYGIKGKLVLLVLFLVAAGGFGVLFTQKLKPDLDREKERALLMKQVKEEAAPQEPPNKDEKPQPNGGRAVPVIPPGGAGGPGGGNKVP